MAFSSTTKYNYIEVVNRVVPEFYRIVDYQAFGSEEDISITFAGKILKAAVENNLYFDVSSLTSGTIVPYFIPKNKKTKLSPNDFQNKILTPYGKNFSSFHSTRDLYDFFSGTFLPDSVLNNPSGLFSTLSGVGFGTYSSMSSVHQYLIDTLGMMYFLNTSGLSSTTASSTASAILVSAVLIPITRGETVTEKHAINALFEYFWKNREESTYYNTFFPPTFASGAADTSSTTYASGTQLLSSVKSHLETWTDPRLKNHDFLSDSLDILLGGGKYPTKMRDAGVFQRFLKAVSLGIADINLILEEIQDLLSIDECPDEFLELLANNIGWRFLTGDYNRWRAQLRNAVLVYKTKGSMVGLEAAFKMMFPDGIFSVSDITESWESYIPKMLYFLIKTESFIANENLIFNSPRSWFPGRLPDVKFNQVPRTYVEAEDRNYRFIVDAVLEDMNNTFENIQIHGDNFKKNKMWTCLEEPKGFYHRNYPNDPSLPASGITVVVPPWEKYGFYRETYLNKRIVNYFCNTLSGAREDFGFEINEAYVSGFKNLVMSALNTTYSPSGTPTWAENDKFRLFTSGNELPPNYAKFVQYGHASAIEDFDTWNTKSSHIFTVLNASSLDYTINRYDTFKNKAALEVYVDVLREFIPLHVVGRVLLYQDLVDTHEVFSKLCVIAEECVDDFNIEYLRSYRRGFWAGASGGGDLGATYVNGDGRVLPSYVSGTNMFWHAGVADLFRNASRRRNYRYALPCYSYGRGGKAMPVALNHYGYATSASQATVSADPYLNTWEYVIKGYDYQLQNYLPTSSVVWAASGWFSGVGGNCVVTGTTTSSFDLSTTYPIRAVPDTETACSSVVIYRDTMKGILEVMTRTAARNYLDGTVSSVVFSDLDYRSFEFGNTVHEGYSIYQNDFGGALNTPATRTDSTTFDGGFNFLSYAFGPTIWNSYFEDKGAIVANTGSATTPYIHGRTGLGGGVVLDAPLYPYGYVPEWSSVVGGTDAGGQKYKNREGSSVTLNHDTYFGSAPRAASVTALEGVIHTTDDIGNSILKTNEILSGLEVRQRDAESKSFIVVSDGSFSSGFNAVLNRAVTMYSPDGKGLDLVVPFDPNTVGTTHYNMLRPNSQFRCDIVTETVSNLQTQHLQVELTTSGGTGHNGKTWGYDWKDNRWRLRTVGDTREFFSKEICIYPNQRCPEVHSIEFNTQEEFTDKSIPCGDTLFTGDVHTTSTAYLLKVRTATPSQVFEGVVSDGINIYEISIVDKVLNSLTKNFNSAEIFEIYTFWNTLSFGAYSRDSSKSADFFEAEGGSRAEYEEMYGGADFTSSATVSTKTRYNFIVND
tara:strand:- start:10949 stop:14932 length:3984 start_codon:yes stop_codon:yes gene_type:complete